MNKIEALKSERDGLDVTEDLIRFAREGWKTIGDDDVAGRGAAEGEPSE